ncbi:FKBP-type peptidyl-prolyl cis-trans isomerase [Spirochaeta cellobiosiphila]|uniref:FKBP-type peptidyl-prolyl cis-trans isomerase n=1 Tax=Spirochaeta cellobiosiphila TaxID=504483 RepID=UPI0004222BCF|nr:peptidylprolyl isomerase [Spirochaeta cellobiosiphila]
MKINADLFVEIHYEVKNGEGEVLDSSEMNGPLSFIYGRESLMPGLERALLGKEEGQRFQFHLSQTDAFGAWDPDKTLTVAKNLFEDPSMIELGRPLEVQHKTGRRVMTIKEIKEETVLLDGNHPWAGQDLDFDVEVVEVRDATPEEWYARKSGGCGCGSGGGSCGCGSGDSHGEGESCGCGGHDNAEAESCSCGGNCDCGASA